MPHHTILFVRFDGPEIRAILSTRYIPISNSELIELFSDQDFEVDVDLTATRMTARLITKDIREGMRYGSDYVRGGLTISNSEVGFGSVELQAFTHRLICLNGMIISGQISMKRIHLKSRDNLNGEVRDISARILDSLPHQLGKMRDSQDIHVPEPQAVLKRISEHYKLTEPEIKAIDRAYPFEEGSRLFNIIGVITRAANDTSLSSDSRVKLQETGGRVLTGAENGRWLS